MPKKRGRKFAEYEGGAWFYGDTLLKRHQGMPPGERAAKLRCMITHAESRGGRMYDRLIAVYKLELSGLVSTNVNASQHKAA